MNGLNVAAGCRRDDAAGYTVGVQGFPDSGKGQGQTIYSLEVEGLSVAGTPFIKATGRNQASVLTECITEAREGINGLRPRIEKRRPARGGESPDGREHVTTTGISPDNGNRGSGCNIVAGSPVLLPSYNAEILGNPPWLSLTNESAAHGVILYDTDDLKIV